jgi:hypothetical protein
MVSTKLQRGCGGGLIITGVMKALALFGFLWHYPSGGRSTAPYCWARVEVQAGHVFSTFTARREGGWSPNYRDKSPVPCMAFFDLTRARWWHTSYILIRVGFLLPLGGWCHRWGWAHRYVWWGSVWLQYNGFWKILVLLDCLFSSCFLIEILFVYSLGLPLKSASLAPSLGSIRQNENPERTEVVAQVVEHLPTKCEVLNSNPNTSKRKR